MGLTSLVSRFTKGLIFCGLAALVTINSTAQIITRVDNVGNRISEEHFRRYGRKPLQEIIAETYNSLGAPIYNYNSVFQLVGSVQRESVRSDDLMLFGFLFGLASGSPAATARQSLALDVASSTLNTAAVVEGQKEAAGIIAGGNNQQPFLRQNFIPRGKNGACVIRYPGKGDALFMVCNKPWEDIDRSGTATINEFGITPNLRERSTAYFYGVAPSGESQIFHHKIIKDGKVVTSFAKSQFNLEFEGEEAVGNYEGVWYCPDGRVMASVPFKVGDPSAQPAKTTQPSTSSTNSYYADPLASVYVYERWDDKNKNGALELPEECIGLHNERPVKIKLNEGRDISFSIQYSYASVGKVSSIKTYDEDGESEVESKSLVVPGRGFHTLIINGERLKKNADQVKEGKNRGTVVWYVDGKYVDSVDVEIEK